MSCILLNKGRRLAHKLHRKAANPSLRGVSRENTGDNLQSNNYWSSTPSGSDAWNVNVNLNGSNANANFNEDDTSNPYNVLGCLAYWVIICVRSE